MIIFTQSDNIGWFKVAAGLMFRDFDYMFGPWMSLSRELKIDRRALAHFGAKFICKIKTKHTMNNLFFS